MSSSQIAFPPIGTYHNTEVVPVGTISQDTEGRDWEFVQFVDAVAYVRGHVCSWSNPAEGTRSVTNDESAGNDVPAGALPTQERTVTAVVPTEDQYGWIQRKGLHPAVHKTAGVDTFASGNACIMHATGDGQANKAASVASPSVADIARGIGRATAASEDGAAGTWDEDTVPIYLDCPHG